MRDMSTCPECDSAQIWYSTDHDEGTGWACRDCGHFAPPRHDRVEE